LKGFPEQNRAEHLASQSLIKSMAELEYSAYLHTPQYLVLTIELTILQASSQRPRSFDFSSDSNPEWHTWYSQCRASALLQCVAELSHDPGRVGCGWTCLSL